MSTRERATGEHLRLVGRPSFSTSSATLHSRSPSAVGMDRLGGGTAPAWTSRSRDKSPHSQSHLDLDSPEVFLAPRRAPHAPVLQRNPTSKSPLIVEDRGWSGVEELDKGLPGRRRQGWKPFYLRHAVLLLFAFVFALMVIAVEILNVVSERNQGIATSNDSLFYIWTFGPIAVLTIIGVFWARVDYQAKVAFPWILMSGKPRDPADSLLLDYVSMFPPKAVFVALRRRHFLVASTTTISLLLKLLIVLAAGLFALHNVQVAAGTVAVTIQDKFSDTSPSSSRMGIPTGTSDSYRIMVGLVAANLTYPDALGTGVAFQDFTTPPLSDGQSIQTTVDGFTSALQCQKADMTLAGNALVIGLPNCNLSIDLTDPLNPINLTSIVSTKYIFGPMTCGSVLNTDPTNTSSIFAAVLDVDPSIGKLRSTQIVCNSTQALSKVLVTTSLSGRSVAFADPPLNRTLTSYGGFDFLVANSLPLRDDLIEQSFVGQINYTVAPLHFFPQLPPALYIGLGLNPSLSTDSLWDQSSMTTAISSFWEQFAAVVANHELRQANVSQTTGARLDTTNRLQLGPLNAHIMTGVLGLALLLVLVSFFSVPFAPFLPTSPNTIIGMAALLANSRSIRERLKATGHEAIDVTSGRLSNSKYSTLPASSESADGFKILSTTDGLDDKAATYDEYPSETGKSDHVRPWTTRTTTRIAAILTIAAAIAWISTLYYISETKDGIVNIGEDYYTHYLWTSLPTLVFVGFSAHLASLDFCTRALAPFHILQQPSTFRNSMSITFLDNIGVKTLILAARTGYWLAMVTSVLSILSSLLALFGGTLYTVSTFSLDDGSVVKLQRQDWFASGAIVSSSSSAGGASEPNMLGTLVATTNVGFPPWTYEQFVIPELKLSTPLASSLSNASIATTVPALRPQYSCVFHTTPQLNVTTSIHSLGPGFFEVTKKLQPTGTTSTCLTEFNFFPNAYPSNFFFGVASVGRPDSGCASDYAFYWGVVRSSESESSSYDAVLFCNETFVEVDTRLTLAVTPGDNGPVLRVDASNAPAEVPASQPRPYPITQDLTHWGIDVLNPGDGTGLDNFFTMLLRGRFAPPDQGPAHPTNDTNAPKPKRFVVVDPHNGADNTTLTTPTSPSSPSSTPSPSINPLTNQAVPLPPAGISFLASNDTAAQVVSGILRLAAAFRAQTLSRGLGVRMRYNETSALPPFATPPPPPAYALSAAASSSSTTGGGGAAAGEAAPPLFGGTVVGATRRLVQNAGPTAALLGLLAAVLGGYVLAAALDRRGRDARESGGGAAGLPKEPFAIAAVASLLADSNLWRRGGDGGPRVEALPRGAEHMTDTELEEWGEGRLFRMGWFDDGKGGRRFTIGACD